MVANLKLDYEQIAHLVDQLTEEQQQALIIRILTHRASQRSLTPEEKIQLLDMVKLDNLVNEIPSIRREDWYDDDGR
ncbi:MAG: hypothetical protein CUN52_07850 [Phototrophicales bacterium]|nr:MAG: hypothetical protein CUN52_07850 [Phototrophicales bacterium]